MRPSMEALDERSELWKQEKLRLDARGGKLRALYYWRAEEAEKKYSNYRQLVSQAAARCLQEYITRDPLDAGGSVAERTNYYGNLAFTKAALLVALRLMAEHPADYPSPLPRTLEQI